MNSSLKTKYQSSNSTVYVGLKRHPTEFLFDSFFYLIKSINFKLLKRIGQKKSTTCAHKPIKTDIIIFKICEISDHIASKY